MTTRGDIFLDTENLFREFSNQDVELVQRAISALEWWFARESTSSLRFFASYGKPTDSGVMAFDEAIAAAPSRYIIEEGLEPKRNYLDVVLRLVQVDKSRQSVFVVRVGDATHEAERKLIADITSDIRLGDLAESLLIGSADHEAMIYANQLSADDPAVRIWCALPNDARVSVHRFGSQGDGNYPLLERSRVSFINDLLSSFLGWLHGAPVAVLERDARQRTHDRDAVVAIANALAVSEPELDPRFWDIADIDWENLHQTVPGGPEWNEALRSEPWLIEAVTVNLTAAAGRRITEIRAARAGFYGCQQVVTMAALTPLIESLDKPHRAALRAVVKRERDLSFVLNAFVSWAERFE
ncbi:MAG: hypothetical protein ABI400_07375 [Lacisediminihabitans sp.]